MEEYVATVEDPGLIADFRAQVLNPLRAGALRDADWRSPAWQVLRSRFVLALGGLVCSVTGRMKRKAVDWSA
jgi:hypothetical protein